MGYSREDLLNFFNVNNILFKEYEHEALFTVEQSKEMRGKIQGYHTKNLFLKDKKKKYFLLSCAEDKVIDFICELASIVDKEVTVEELYKESDENTNETKKNLKKTKSKSEKNKKGK